MTDPTNILPEPYQSGRLIGKIPTVSIKETVALKPCPFCGSDVMAIQEQDGFSNVLYWSIRHPLKDCILRNIPLCSRNLDELVEQWNRRVNE
ncbi:MAG: hypothetical protein E7Z65_06310 [Thermoplasmata archaeon]|nr:hypothetical protein [Thermoplasmata archaeon]